MNTFTSKCADAVGNPPDPRQHVNYIQGMVLGADDMVQDFTYHAHQRQWLARESIGYGTLSGLHVEVVTRDVAKGPEIVVSPGAALSPRGQLLRVTPRQCAALNPWLALPETRQKLTDRGLPMTGSGALTAYVVLCFRDCPVDPLPIPGEPCRCADQAMAPSRILDDFRLELRLEPPAQREEDAIRDFTQWIRQIKIAEPNSNSSTLTEFIETLRSAAHDLTSPLESPPDFLYGSPPPNLAIPADQLCNYLRAALRFWVTELRPLWEVHWAKYAGGGCGCHGVEHSEGKDAEECLMLAELNIPLFNRQVPQGQLVPVSEERRPFVVHLRLLQEMLLCPPRSAAGCNNNSFATVFALDEHTLRIWIHHPFPLSVPSTAVHRLELDGQIVSGFNLTQVAGTGSGSETMLNIFDLDLGVSPPVQLAPEQRVFVQLDPRLMTELISPPKALFDRLTEGQFCYPDFRDDLLGLFCVVELFSASNLVVPGTAFNHLAGAGSSAAYSRADHTHGTPPAPELRDDVTGKAQPNTGVIPAVVERIQRVKVSPTAPTVTQVLQFDGTQWAPATLPLLVGDAVGPIAQNKVTGIQGLAVPAPNSNTDNGKQITFQKLPGQAAKWVLQQSQNTPDVVEHPTGLGKYFIVAAGTVGAQVKTDGSFSGPRAFGQPYNELRVINWVQGSGTLFLTFKDLKVPAANGDFQYAVKVLPTTPENFDGPLVVVNLLGFQPAQGTKPVTFSLRVALVNGILDPRQANILDLMIEVSQYFK